LLSVMAPAASFARPLISSPFVTMAHSFPL
jgi:hypothetical protein